MTQHPRVTCRQFVEFLSDYLSNELPAATHQDFEWHLGRCPDCVRYLATFKTTIALCRKAFEPLDREVPAEAPEELIQAILAARRNP
jgi:anti-sigma factor RsiW